MRVDGTRLMRPALTFALLVVFMNSLASPQTPEKAVGTSGEEIAGALSLTGTVAVRGKVTVNGNAIKSGFTLLSGSVIATGSDGLARIDLGELGRVELRPDTIVVLDFVPGQVHAKVQCSRFKVAVRVGEVDVRWPEDHRLLKAGEDARFKETAEAFAPVGADFILACGVDRLPAAFLWGGPATGTVLAVGGSTDEVTVSSPTRP